MPDSYGYRDKDTLHRMYVKKEQSAGEIAEHFGAGRTTIIEWLDRHDIERRDSYKEASDVRGDLLRDKDWLQQKYHKEGLTLEEVGEIANCADSTVRYWIQNHDMETDSKSESFTDGDVGKLQDQEWLREQYHEKDRSQKDIAEELGLTQGAVYKYMLKHGIEARDHGEHLTDGEIEKLHDPEFLREQYWGKRKSSPKIAEEIGVAQQSIIEALHNYDIETRHGTPSGEDHWNAKPDQPANGRYYGPNWIDQRTKARINDQARCQRCGMTDAEHNREYNQDIHVHHITNRREFIDEDGILDYEAANDLENLVTLCFACHRKVETLPLEIDVR